MDYIDKDEYVIKSKSNTQQNYILAQEYIIKKSTKEINKHLIKVLKSFFTVRLSYHHWNLHINTIKNPYLCCPPHNPGIDNGCPVGPEGCRVPAEKISEHLDLINKKIHEMNNRTIMRLLENGAEINDNVLSCALSNEYINDDTILMLIEKVDNINKNIQYAHDSVPLPFILFHRRLPADLLIKKHADIFINFFGMTIFKDSSFDGNEHKIYLSKVKNAYNNEILKIITNDILPFPISGGHILLYKMIRDYAGFVIRPT